MQVKLYSNENDATFGSQGINIHDLSNNNQNKGSQDSIKFSSGYL